MVWREAWTSVLAQAMDRAECVWLVVGAGGEMGRGISHSRP